MTARTQAESRMQSLREMVAALDVDYDRLEELREEKDTAEHCAQDAQELQREAQSDVDYSDEERQEYEEQARQMADELSDWLADNAEELAELESAAGDCKDREDAERRIHEDALSVEVRSGWRSLGDDSEDTEFRIVLCTGGPHVQVAGTLAQGEPDRAWLEYQDWATPMTERCNYPGDQDALLAYARCFFFGE